jgi:hypothetical protein
MDVVATCPRGFWNAWIAEGSPAGGKDSRKEYAWWTKSRIVLKLQPGDRFYVVCRGKLRGWAPVTGVIYNPDTEQFGVIRRAGAVACTIAKKIPGFQGVRNRFWNYEDELPFPDWRTP